MLKLMKGDVSIDPLFKKQSLEIILVKALDKGVGDGLLFWVISVEI